MMTGVTGLAHSIRLEKAALRAATASMVEIVILCLDNACVPQASMDQGKDIFVIVGYVHYEPVHRSSVICMSCQLT